MKNKMAAFLIFCFTSLMFGSCAADAEEFSTQHDPKYAITYLLTDFEVIGNRGAEALWLSAANQNDPHMGYFYMFDDNKQDNDWVVPHAQNSNMCKDAEGNDLNPIPKACEAGTGSKPLSEQDRPFTLFGSQKSFNFHGTATVSGAGWGIYFADYVFTPTYNPNNPNKLLISPAGKIAPVWSNMRKLADGQPLCKDNGNFLGTVDSEFMNPATRTVFKNENVHDSDGLYRVEGGVWTAGVVYVDENGMENYKLDYDLRVTEDDKESIKEPRCLSDMGQEGFVMWARGNTAIEVALILPESAPNIDGGVCDLDGMEKCYDHQRVVFELDDEWREYHASWDDFSQEGWGTPVALDPNRIINIQIKVPGYKDADRGRDFNVWLDQVGFYGGTTWQFTQEVRASKGW